MRQLPAWASIDAAIVDLDGTMVDTLGDFVQALGASFASLGLPAPEAGFVAGAIGKGSKHLIKQSLRAVGVVDPSSRYEAAWQAYQAQYEIVNGRYSSAYPGVAEGLAGLRAAGLRLACVTNKPTRFARRLLDLKGLAPNFEFIFGGDHFERQKPDPTPFVETCKALGTAPQRTLVVGDSSNDAAAARGARCPVVLVSYGYNHGEPVASAGADVVIDSLTELPRLLMRR